MPGIQPHQNRITFSGEYSTFNEVREAHPDLSQYHSSTSLDGLVEQAKLSLFRFSRNEIPDSVWGNGRENLVLAALSTLNQEGPIKILDVGG